jgi:hypothetical protein
MNPEPVEIVQYVDIPEFESTDTYQYLIERYEAYERTEDEKRD